MRRRSIQTSAVSLSQCTRYGRSVLLTGALAVLLSGCFLAPNQAPTARIAADASRGIPPLVVSFDGTGSDDEDGIVRAYEWSFGDGITSAAMRPTHSYALPGEYVVTLVVTDDDGASASATLDVVVTKPNTPPVARFSVAPSAPLPGETVRFDAGESADADGQVVAYRWDFGDGTEGEGETVDHPYTTAGTYTVVLTVIDDQDTIGTSQRDLQIVDDNQPPSPHLDVSTVALDPGDTLYCSADGSVDSDGEIVSLQWRFGDGATAEGSTASHVYATAGTYRLILTVTDDRGASRSTECWIAVGDAPVSPDPDPVPEPDPSDVISLGFRWSYGGSVRSLPMRVPESLYAYYQDQPRGVWAADGYSDFVLDTHDDALMLELRNDLLIDNSYQATIENALAFVQKAVTYQSDPAGTEYPRYPVETLVEGIGDCEDSAILYASIVRTFGYSAGALLVTVDTNGDQVADHVAVFVRVADCFVNAHPERSLWTISGKVYAFAETAVSGGYLALGIDPWGLEQDDIHNIWDVAGSSKSLSATRMQHP